MTSKRYVNLVFQGGGVRGIAYAGALAAIPPDVELHTVGGTSAGAIVAALLAVGIRGDELKNILSSRELFDLLDLDETKRAARLSTGYNALADAWKKEHSWLTWLKLLILACQHRQAVEDIRRVWSDRGLHKSTKIRRWLDSVLKGANFADVKVSDLRIVAADVSEQRYVVYSKATHKPMSIAEAVHASLSIPLFFAPFTKETVVLVDGGLLSNFPTFLFTQGEYFTVGLRLDEVKPPEKIDSTADYLRALLLTMAAAHDKHRGDPPHFRAYPITTPPYIPSTKFDLTERDVNELYALGMAVGRAIPWDELASERPIVSYYDPKPQDALQLTLARGRELWEQYGNRALWAEKVEYDGVFTVYVEQDWSSRYEMMWTIEVFGSKPIFMSRSFFVSSDDQFGEQSIADLKQVCEEITETGRQALIAIPAMNSRYEKGAVVFYVPPLSAGKKRKFHIGFLAPGEFADTLGHGTSDVVSQNIRQLAEIHTTKLRMRVLIDVSHENRIACVPEFGGIMENRGTEFDARTTRTYRVWESDIGEKHISGETIFAVRLEPK